MARTIRYLSLAAGSLSVAGLATIALHIGLGPTLRTVFAYYERFLSETLGRAEPPIRSLFHALNAYVHIDLHLYPHWKHVFVLTGIYVFRHAGQRLRLGWKVGPLVYFALGMLIDAVVSVACGAIPLDRKDFVGNAIIVILPLVGIYLYNDIDRRTWHYFAPRRPLTTADPIVSPEMEADMNARLPKYQKWGRYTRFLTRFATLALFITSFGVLHAAMANDYPSPGLLALGCFVLGYALIAVLDAVMLYLGPDASGEREKRIHSGGFFKGITWYYSGRLGFDILSTFAGALAFLAMNAGLSSFGL